METPSLNPSTPLARVVYFLLLMAVLAVLIAPTAATVVFARLFPDPATNLSDYVPLSSDEVLFWHQIDTFREAGFNGGYYTINEVPASAAFSHFYTKGPVFPALYGTLARLTGWQLDTGVYFNIIVVTAALAIFIVITRPNHMQLIALGLVVVTFWPLMSTLPLIMQEAFQSALALILAGLFYRIIQRPEPLSPLALVAVTLFILVASLVRGVTWAMLFAPLFAIQAYKARGLAFIPVAIAALATGMLFFTAYWAFGQVSLPESNIMSALAGSGFMTRVSDNLVTFAGGFSLENSERFQVLFLALVSAGLALRGVLPNRGLKSPARRKLSEYAFHALNLGLILVANILFYRINGWRDYRVLAPNLLLSLLLLVAFRRYWLVALIVAVNLLMLPKFRDLYVDENFTYPSAQIAEFRDSIDGQMVYDAAAPSAWCNTLLLYSSEVLGPPFTAVPAGIGISIVREERDGLAFPLQSRYLLLDDASRAAWGDQLHIQPLSDTPYGRLYLNLDADC
jgi:hypothetical protein